MHFASLHHYFVSQVEILVRRLNVLGDTNVWWSTIAIIDVEVKGDTVKINPIYLVTYY